MPRLQGRVREVLDRMETLELQDEVADFRKLAATVERRAWKIWPHLTAVERSRYAELAA